MDRDRPSGASRARSCCWHDVDHQPIGCDEHDAGLGSRLWAVALCWVAVALDGFDLVVIGAVIPTLSKTGDLGFTDASLTTAATLGLVGVGIGAVLIGPLTDRFGRRRSLIACITWFSILTLAVAFAGSVASFTALRFLAGLGLGACLPTALAYMSEAAKAGPQRQRGHPRDDRLPRGRRTDRAARAVADRRLGLGGDVRDRRRRRAAHRAGDVGEAPRV